SLRRQVRGDEALVKLPSRLDPNPPMKGVGMVEFEGIVQQHAAALLKRASTAVVTWSVVGALAGAILGLVPRLFSHNLINPGVSYFAVLAGAIAGGYLGRSFGRQRAVALRYEAQVAIRRLAAGLQAAPAPVVAPAPAPVAPLPPPPVAAVPVSAPPA